MISGADPGDCYQGDLDMDENHFAENLQPQITNHSLRDELRHEDLKSLTDYTKGEPIIVPTPQEMGIWATEVAEAVPTPELERLEFLCGILKALLIALVAGLILRCCI